ncbi:gliding motility-associated C-terminal domain-containing protein, partial [Saprospiraceae bacterium]|jgi:gliding motility-associated-like protein|nr:gliding motility-associated C-terminal domain-containing protein [Saprospiraceae bacterium]
MSLMSFKRIGIIIGLSIYTIIIFAQEPFICRGSFYLTLANLGTKSKAFEVVVDPVGGDVQFSPLNDTNTGEVLNSIGFRSTDSFIYGIDPGTYNLFQVDSTGSAFLIGNVASGVNTSRIHIAGDITPDGRYLVLLESTDTRDEALVFIDLESPTFAATKQMLSGTNTRCADVAFDPLTSQLYGFNTFGDRLVIFNTTNGSINANFPSTDVADFMGAIFFDAFGNLFGYGRRKGASGNGQDGFFSVDKNTGIVTLEAIGPAATGNDGCSCPYRVELREWVAINEELVPCTTVPITIEIANTSGREQTGLTFEHYFPESFQITDISIPFPATITEGGIGSDYFIYEDLNVPVGIHQITVWVELLPDASGFHELQSTLSGLPTELGEIEISDNPFTLIQDDPATMTVNELNIDFSAINTNICPGDEITLEPGIFGVDYLWSDGSTDPTFSVSDGGTYAVTVTSGCEVQIETVTVQVIPLNVQLEPYHEIELGDDLTLFPFLFPVGDNYFFSWESTNELEGNVNVQNLNIQPFFDGNYTISVDNGQGCQDSASTFVKVLKNRKIYFPNAFSPNSDGFNDFFFPASKNPEIVLSFQIFDRWGSLVFENYNFQTEQVDQGWDGEHNDQKLSTGVYVYKAEIQFLDGEVFTFTGDVSLVR